MSTFLLKLLTPYRTVVQDDAVVSVELPGEQGSFGVLARHTKFMSLLQPGVVKVVKLDSTQCFTIGGGFAEVRDSELIVLADSAERVEEIDLGRAEQALANARKRLAEVDPADTRTCSRLQQKIARAENRIRARKSCQST